MANKITIYNDMVPILDNYVDLGATGYRYKDVYIVGSLKDDTDSVLIGDIATEAYVNAAVLGENLWDLTVATLSPHTANNNVDLGSGNFLTTGSIGVTGSRILKGWFTDLQVTNLIAGGITGNAATVTTNANLTGVITSAGNATSIASQTGTGTKFVVDTSPTLVTPTLGVATATSLGIGGAVSGALLHISPTDQTTAAYGLKFGTDTNLYRSAANTLKTDDSLTVNGNIYSVASYGYIAIGAGGPYINMFYDNGTGYSGFGFNLYYDGSQWAYANVAGWGGTGQMLSLDPASGMWFKRATNGANPATVVSMWGVDTNGNVGSGTTSPSHKLHIVDSDTTASRAGAYVSQTGAIAGTGYAGYFTKTGASTINEGIYASASGATTNYGVYGITSGSATTNVGVYASASGATNNYAGIFNAGNVGIGTTTPTYQLEMTKGFKVGTTLYANTRNWNFTGTNSRVNLGDITEINSAVNLTECFWVNQTTVPSTGYLFNKSASTGEGMSAITFVGGSLVVYFNTGGSPAATLNTYSAYMVAGRWHHIAYVYDGAGATNADKIKLYIDGVYVAFSSFTGTIPSSLWDNTGRNALIGFSGSSMTGYMYDFRIYNASVSASDITTIYQGGTYTTNMVHQYKLMEGIGSVALDTGSNVVNGAYTNGAWANTGNIAIGADFGRGTLTLAPAQTTAIYGLWLGYDNTNLYRCGAQMIGTDALFRLANNVTSPTTSAYGLTFGGAVAGTPDTAMYRSAADTIYTPDSLIVAGSLGATGTRVLKGWFTDLQTTNAPIVDTLTAGRVLFAGASKEFVDDADMTFSGDTLTLSKLVLTSLTTIGGTAPVADGQYTVGSKITPVTGNDGKITVKSGIITAIQQAT